MTFTDVHGLLGRSFLFFSALITLWALLQTVRGREIGGDFWGAVAIGEGLIVLQTIVGIILVLQHRMPARPIHFVYGGVALLLWPAVFAFTRGDTSRRAGRWWLLAGFLRRYLKVFFFTGCKGKRQEGYQR